MEITKLTLKTVFNFGMHKGKTVEKVLLDDPTYILNYCIIKGECFVEGLKEYIDKANKEMDNRKYLHDTHENNSMHIDPVTLKYITLYHGIEYMKKVNITLEDIFKRNEEKKKMYLNQIG